MELGGYHHPGAVQNESFTSQRGVVRILLYAPPEAVLNPYRHGEVIMIPHGTMLLGDGILFGHIGLHHPRLVVVAGRGAAAGSRLRNATKLRFVLYPAPLGAEDALD